MPNHTPRALPVRVCSLAAWTALGALLAAALGCAEVTTTAVPGPPCDQPGRAEYCKDTCPTETCADAAQATCEAECRACAPDEAYCPAPEEP